MTLSQIKTYTIGVLKQWFGNKDTLDKISESQAGNLVYNGTEIKDNTEQVNAVTTKVDNIKRYQKYINAELDSCYVKLMEDYSPIEGEYLPFQKVSGSLEVNNGRIIVQPNQRIHLSLSLSYSDSTNEVFPDIAFSFKDYTNDVVINAIPEFDFINFCQYTNNTDIPCEVGIYVEKINTVDILNNMTTLTAQEINKIVVDPLDYVNESHGIEDTPVGHIIAHMGMVAPKHYLICDGTEYRVTDYPYLVEHIEHQFGSVNYFGGDGVTTFCVPDLRGEFLRGTGTATRNTGSGAEVGEHQDPTSFTNVQVGDSNIVVAQQGNSMLDTRTATGNHSYTKISGTASDGYNFTSRPTNTAVLYCIKCEPTFFIANKNTNYNTNYIMPNMYSLEEKIVGSWIDGKPLYQKTFIFSEGYYGNQVFQTGITDIEMCQIKDGRYRMVNNTIPLNYSHPTADSLITTYVRCTTGEICLRPGAKYTESNKIDELQITLQYTKTTDAENSFTIDMIKNLTT